MWNDRTKLLIGENKVKTLEKSSVCVIGLGGVGGYVCHMLVRAGVGKLTLVDFDKIDETNINRQIVADITTVGKLKTDVLKQQLLNINPKLKVSTFSERFEGKNAEIILKQKFDFVVDAIDSVADKIELICFCKEHNINIVSAMGAGNRYSIPDFKIVDIYKTSNDGLAKVMRKKLRERGVGALNVACTSQIAEKVEGKVGSISFYPAMCGCVIAGFVVNELLKGGNDGNYK